MATLAECRHSRAHHSVSSRVQLRLSASSTAAGAAAEETMRHFRLTFELIQTSSGPHMYKPKCGQSSRGYERLCMQTNAASKGSARDMLQEIATPSGGGSAQEVMMNKTSRKCLFSPSAKSPAGRIPISSRFPRKHVPTGRELTASSMGRSVSGWSRYSFRVSASDSASAQLVPVSTRPRTEHVRKKRRLTGDRDALLGAHEVETEHRLGHLATDERLVVHAPEPPRRIVPHETASCDGPAPRDEPAATRIDESVQPESQGPEEKGTHGSMPPRS